MDGWPPAEMPAQWGKPSRAVSQDLQCGRHGGGQLEGGGAWELTVHVDGAVYIGLTPGSDDADDTGFAIGRGYTLEVEAARATVWIADAVQELLAAYEFVQ
jgi:hypothetical protein